MLGNKRRILIFASVIKTDLTFYEHFFMNLRASKCILEHLSASQIILVHLRSSQCLIVHLSASQCILVHHSASQCILVHLSSCEVVFIAIFGWDWDGWMGWSQVLGLLRAPSVLIKQLTCSPSEEMTFITALNQSILDRHLDAHEY